MNEYDTVCLQDEIEILKKRIQKLEDWVNNKEYQLEMAKKDEVIFKPVKKHTWNKEKK